MRRPDRSVLLERPLQDASTDTRLRGWGAERIPPGSFTMDPGMRAQAGQFTDVTSRDYARQAAAQAKRGGAMQYATSVEEEQADASADTKRDLLMIALLTLLGGKGLGHGVRRLSTNPLLRNRHVLGPVGPQQFAKYSPPALDHATGNAMAAIIGGVAGIGRTEGQSRRAEAERERRGWLDEVQGMRGD